MICSICGIQIAEANSFFKLSRIDPPPSDYYCARACSPSCLVELAWKLRQDLPKLSKSQPQGE